MVWPYKTFVLSIFAIVVIVASEPAYCCDKDVQIILELLLDLPPWPMARLVGKDDAQRIAILREDAEGITDIAARLDAFDLDDIRAALVQYQSSSYYQPEMAFVINQYLFDIPERKCPLSQDLITAYTTITLHATHLNISPSWPWRKQANGQMIFEVLSIGLVRNGPPYPAVRAFDVYRKRFGRREAR